MNDYLIHHGILGQKWGVRRYQNEDGSLTPAGEKRYRKEAEKKITQLQKDRINAADFEFAAQEDYDGALDDLKYFKKNGPFYGYKTEADVNAWINTTKNELTHWKNEYAKAHRAYKKLEKELKDKGYDLKQTLFSGIKLVKQTP